MLPPVQGQGDQMEAHGAALRLEPEVLMRDDRGRHGADPVLGDEDHAARPSGGAGASRRA